MGGLGNSKRRLATIIAIVVALAGVSPAAGTTPRVSAKASYLARLHRYVVWPTPRSESVLLCVVGASTIVPWIRRAAPRQEAEGRRLVIRRLAAASPGAACDVAYSPAADENFLAAFRNRPVLTVTGGRGPRGIVHFVTVRDRVRLAIDDAQAARSGLTIDARLLGLAFSVRQRRR